MHLTTHGQLVAISDMARGVTVILAPDDGITDEAWLEAIAEHNVSETYADWDYAEADGWCVWTLLHPARISFTFDDALPAEPARGGNFAITWSEQGKGYFSFEPDGPASIPMPASTVEQSR